jgi:hypothetical protein
MVYPSPQSTYHQTWIILDNIESNIKYNASVKHLGPPRQIGPLRRVAMKKLMSLVLRTDSSFLRMNTRLPRRFGTRRSNRHVWELWTQILIAPSIHQSINQSINHPVCPVHRPAPTLAHAHDGPIPNINSNNSFKSLQLGHCRPLSIVSFHVRWEVCAGPDPSRPTRGSRGPRTRT